MKNAVPLLIFSRVIVFIVCCWSGVVAFAQSQPPAPTPSKGTEIKKDQTGGGNRTASAANTLPPAGAPQVVTTNQNSPSQSRKPESSGIDPNWVIAAFTVVLTVVGWRQLVQTRRAVDAARINADAAMLSAKAAEQALRLDIGMRQNHSIYSIADKFEEQAHAWALKGFQIDQGMVDRHNKSINDLSPYVHYLETYHRPVYDALIAHWTLFHGGDTGRAIHQEDYSGHPERWNKDYWVNLLFVIADRIRESQRPR